jgi:hypothetical protein
MPDTLVAVPPDTIVFDPRDPSPTVGGCRLSARGQYKQLGPVDISQIVETRNDILLFSTGALIEELTVKGQIYLKLFVASDRTDTDFAVRLCDVYPDGRSIIVRQAIARARYRDSYEHPKLMEPGTIYGLTVSFDDLAITFKKGHKLRIGISSSNYPIFSVNPNDGGPLYQKADSLIATNLLYHDNLNRSMIVFPTNKLPSSIEKQFSEKGSNLKIYPNPNNGSGKISISSEGNSRAEINIIDIFGNVISNIYKGNLDKESSFGFNIENAPDGIYFLQVKTAKGSRNYKMAKVE